MFSSPSRISRLIAPLISSNHMSIRSSCSNAEMRRSMLSRYVFMAFRSGIPVSLNPTAILLKQPALERHSRADLVFERRISRAQSAGESTSQPRLVYAGGLSLPLWCLADSNRPSHASLTVDSNQTICYLTSIAVR